MCNLSCSLSWFLIPLVLVLPFHAFPVHYWPSPVAVSCAGRVGSQGRGSTGCNRCCIGSAKRCPTGRAFRQATTLGAQTRSFLPVPILHKALVCRYHFPPPPQPCSAAPGKEKAKSRHADSRLTPFLQGGSTFLLMRWLKKRWPAAHRVSRVWWVFPAVSCPVDATSHRSRLWVSSPYRHHKVRNIYE